LRSEPLRDLCTHHREYTIFAFSYYLLPRPFSSIFFFNDTATTELYTLSLHDALPIFSARRIGPLVAVTLSPGVRLALTELALGRDRKSTRLNSSHLGISYAVFCLKKKKHCQRSSMVLCSMIAIYT